MPILEAPRRQIDKPELRYLSQRIASIGDVLSSLVSLGPGFGIWARSEGGQVIIGHNSRRYYESTTFTKSPIVVLSDGQSGPPKIGFIERAVREQTGLPTITGYRAMMKNGSTDIIKEIQEVDAPNPRLLHPDRWLRNPSTKVELPLTQELSDPSNRLGLIEYAKAYNQRDILAANLLSGGLIAYEEIAQKFTEAAQDPGLNPLLSTRYSS